MRLRKGDQVIVLSGRDKGRTGTIVKVLPSLNKVVIEGINMVRRAYKPTTKQPKGGLKSEPRPLFVSKVAMVHPRDSKRGSRLGYKPLPKGKKVRIYRQAGNPEVKG